MYTLYQLILTLLFYAVLPILFISVLITGNHRRGIRQRLGLYRRLPIRPGGTRIWLHAASVGEVQAAANLIEELRLRLPQAVFLLTTMTVQGREVATRQLPGVSCLLAPLDVPGIVDWVIHALAPDIYVCLETELWPVLLRRLHRRHVPVVLANGRMSAHSAERYQRYARFFRKVLENFDRLCLISSTDRDRYLAAGADEERCEVTGNLKYDRQLPTDPAEIRSACRQLLKIGPEHEVLITGSTHGDEEERLLPAFRRLRDARPLLWIVAPRHLDRLDQVRELLAARGLGFDLLSSLKAGETRRHHVVLVDSLGDLSRLYSVGTYIFCGGSLVARRGHNIMEAALWNRAVLYGPSMDDFRDAADLLEAAGAGFAVRSGEELAERIAVFRDNPEEYRLACERAGAVARAQQGAAGRHAEEIVALLRRSRGA